jgi:hypothetical protein
MLGFGALFALLCGLSPFARSAEPDREEVERLRKAALSAQSPTVVEEAYARLFRHVGRDGLQALRRDPDTGMALQAAWQLCCDQGAPKPFRDPRRFLGFLEGRTGLAVPKSWEVELVFHSKDNDTALSNSLLEDYSEGEPGVEKRARVRGEKDSYVIYRRKFERTPTHDTFVRPGVTVEVKSGKVTLAVGADKVTVAEEAFEGPSGSRLRGAFCDVRIESGRCYVALDKGMGSEVSLACFDSQSGKVLWQRSAPAVLKERPLALRTGPPPIQDLALDVNANAVGLFRVQTFGVCSLDGFDSGSGKILYRFISKFR